MAASDRTRAMGVTGSKIAIVDAEGEAARRRRFERMQPARALTPLKVRLLQHVAECGLLSTHQIEAISGYSGKSVRNHLRDLYDMGLVERIAVPRVALANINAPNDANLLYGSAPTVYAPTKQGLKLLYEQGLIDKDVASRQMPDYGPKNSLFLAHELEVRDVRIWLERLHQAHPQHGGMEAWHDGTAAHISYTRPDAWFVYRLKTMPSQPSVQVVGLVEVDRGTERGAARWTEKFDYYQPLLSGTTNDLKEATSYERARLVIVAPDAARRDHIMEIIAPLLPGSGVSTDRVWATERATLSCISLRPALWRVPGTSALQPFVPEKFL